MNALTTIAAVTGVLAAGIIYGTDAFCALVQRPALAQLDDATMAAAMGRVHQYGDRRLPAPGIIGILAALTATVAAAAGRIARQRGRSRPRPDRAAQLARPLPARGGPDQPDAHRRGRGPRDSRQRPGPAIALGQHHHRPGPAHGGRRRRPGRQRRHGLTQKWKESRLAVLGAVFSPFGRARSTSPSAHTPTTRSPAP